MKKIKYKQNESKTNFVYEILKDLNLSTNDLIRKFNRYNSKNAQYINSAILKILLEKNETINHEKIKILKIWHMKGE